MYIKIQTFTFQPKQAVQIVNELIIHSPSYELSDVQLANCTEALVEVLQDSKCLQQDHNAQTAVGKLNQVYVTHDKLHFATVPMFCLYVTSHVTLFLLIDSKQWQNYG